MITSTTDSSVSAAPCQIPVSNSDVTPVITANNISMYIAYISYILILRSHLSPLLPYGLYFMHNSGAFPGGIQTIWPLQTVSVCCTPRIIFCLQIPTLCKEVSKLQRWPLDVVCSQCSIFNLSSWLMFNFLFLFESTSVDGSLVWRDYFDFPLCLSACSSWVVL